MNSNLNTSRMCSRLTTLAAAALLCCAPAFAQTMSPRSGQSPMNGGANGQNGQMNGNMQGMNGGNMASSADKMFLKKASEGNIAEIQIAQLALQKSNNDQVKQFAQRMIDDHTKLNDEAKPVAEQAGVTPATTPNKKDEMMMTKLQGMSGDQFDKAYMRDMVKDHTMDLKEFKQEAANGQDQQVKDLAQKGSQVIQSHLDQAKQVASAVGAMNGSMKSGKMGNQGQMGSQQPQ